MALPAPYAVLGDREGVSIAGTSHANEDLWGCADSLTWVLDGATRAGADVRRFVRAVDASVAQVAHSTTADLPLREVLRRAIAAVPASATSPGVSATIALARTAPGQDDEWLVLGDAAVLIHGPDGMLRIETDLRLQDVAREEREARRRLQRSGAPAAEVRRASARLLAAEDAARNVPGGFWVATDDPSAADQAIVGSGAEGSVIALASDGVLPAIPKDAGPERLKALWKRGGVHPWLVDARGRELTRTGRADDMTLVLL
ncbi:hypothetical protein M3C74_00720 [Micrococcus lylae]|uniref:hypothetical protein n=1 Tax=Micrococcus lylae TaxID=1273 RepID=UPI0021A5B36B|nr:hypothetical protein [Micrococcus lylae]MCT2007401.1 hypothetical protein [Micrococcus lylae]MCT2070366.1 hypothetical protein [Micrococcus lylae]